MVSACSCRTARSGPSAGWISCRGCQEAHNLSRTGFEITGKREIACGQPRKHKHTGGWRVNLRAPLRTRAPADLSAHLRRQTWPSPPLCLSIFIIFSSHRKKKSAEDRREVADKMLKMDTGEEPFVAPCTRKQSVKTSAHHTHAAAGDAGVVSAYGRGRAPPSSAGRTAAGSAPGSPRCCTCSEA